MDKILVLDFGGQYNQLIARRVRSERVYAEIKSYDAITVADIKAASYKGIIFTGGPNSVFDESSPHFDPAVLNLNIPVLGICYGHQLMAYMAGGEIASAMNNSEYGRSEVYTKKCLIFEDVPEKSIFWMSHTDYVKRVPAGFEVTAYTDNCPCAAMANEEKKLYGVQFHPEVTHSEYGQTVLKNFIFKVCGCKADWNVGDFAESSIEKYRRELKGKKVLLALSGGVDSSVAAVLLHKAIGDDLTCVFVDHGLLRKGEGDYVESLFKGKFGLNLIRVNAQERFLKKLAGVTDPEKKRKIIGEEFIRVFEEQARAIGNIEVLAQGTIYPDVVESGKGKAATIKSHHNVGGLPENMLFSEIVEPLRLLFKDEVREIGLKLGLPENMVFRQPFPGPGLGVRVIGEITEEKLAILRDADAIFREEMAKSGCEKLSNQYFAVITDCRSVGVMGDFRTYGYTVALRAVTTDDFMTAQWTRLPYDVLETASNRITNEVKNVSRVVYDITSKPPATVEWE
jgi:GMP synthase (glutamine-hydrolysing)